MRIFPGLRDFDVRERLRKKKFQEKKKIFLRFLLTTSVSFTAWPAFVVDMTCLKLTENVAVVVGDKKATYFLIWQIFKENLKT